MNAHTHPTAGTNLEYAARIVAGDPLVSTLSAKDRAEWAKAAQEALDGDDSDLAHLILQDERFETYLGTGSRLEFWEWNEREDRVAAYARVSPASVVL
jgi:hypothetical protein